MASLKDLIVMGPARFLDKIYGNLEGNATSADKLKTARSISLSGAVKGSATFDGSGNIGIATTFAQGMNYAGSSSDGGAANSALKLVDSANKALTIGSANKPVYFSNGIPVEANTIENAKSAEYLSPGATINGTLFDGKDGITTSSWGAARVVTISDNSGTNTQANNDINGSGNFTLKLPATIKANLTGKATSAGTADSATTATTATTCTGNAATATQLKTARSINGTNFDGSGDITTAKWGTARIVTISDNDETNKQANNNINGGNNFTLKLPATIKATLTGNASSASKFYSTTENKTDYTSRFISFFDGSANGNKSSLHNSGLVYDYKAGTTTSTGEAYLRIGTNTNSTTANNMRGNILLYGSSSGFTQIIPLNNTEKNTTLRLPNPGDGAAGTLAWTVYNTATGSSSKPVYITSAGKAVAISNLALGSTTTNDDRSISTARKSSADASYGRVTLHVSSAGDGALFNYTYVNTSGTTTDKYVKLSTSAFYSTADNDLTLGTSSLRWKSVYGVNFYGNLNGVIKRSFVKETSNAMDLVDIYDSDGTTLHMMIGAHNTGNTTGAIYIIPYPKTKDAWTGEEGLYIAKNLLKLDNNRIPTTGNTTGTIGSTSKAVYVDAGVIKEISTLAISKGGTGTSTAPTQGGVIYASSTSAYASTAAGTSGQLLQSAGTGKPTWITATNSNTASTVVKRDSSGNFSAGTITANLTGTASKVNITSTNPSSGTTYMIPFMSSTGSQSLLGNDGIGYWTIEGTTSALGAGELKLGNNKASGTAGNKRGMIYMYGQSSGYTEIIPSNNTTSNVQVYLPSSGGTIALTSSNITGSSASCTGNAATATKLATARNIALSGDFTGSASFNGTANATISATNYKCSVNGGNTNSFPFHRIAYVTGKTGQWVDCDCILDIKHSYNTGGFGRVKISLRTDGTGTAINASAVWLYKYNIKDDAISIAYWGTTGQSCYADVFYNHGKTYPRCTVYQVYGSRVWTLVDSNQPNDGAKPTEAYTTIAAAATALHGGTAYANIVESTQANSVGILPITGGGTGANTPAGALSNLGGVGYKVVTNLSSLL